MCCGAVNVPLRTNKGIVFLEHRGQYNVLISLCSCSSPCRCHFFHSQVRMQSYCRGNLVKKHIHTHELSITAYCWILVHDSGLNLRYPHWAARCRWADCRWTCRGPAPRGPSGHRSHSLKSSSWSSVRKRDGGETEVMDDWIMAKYELMN